GIYNAAYTPAGSKNILEPAIQLTHADGNTSLSLNYVSKDVTKIDTGITQTEILLKDPAYEIEVRLFFKAYAEENIIEAWSLIKNGEDGTVQLHKYASANLYLHGNNDFWLTHYSGDWALEMIPEVSKLSHGIKVLDSKLGARANLFQPSVFMVSLGGQTTEDQGRVLMGGLEWSGNFKNEFEVDPLNNLRVI